MTNDTLYRSVPLADMSLDPDDWTVTGTLAPYGREVELVPGIFEVFTRGVFASATKAAGRIKFRGAGTGDGHENAPIVGHALALEERAEGISGVFRLVDTTAGRDTMTLLRSGVLDELSIEFKSRADGRVVEARSDGTHIRHTRARLMAVAPVPAGAYGRDALVTQVRDAQSAKREAIIEHLRAIKR